MSAYTTLADIAETLTNMGKEIQVGPDGEGQDWINTLEACVEDINGLLGDEIEPSEADQGLIPIPDGYAEQ